MPDNTLPTSTRVLSEGNNTFRIEAGTQSQDSLLHSFESFSLPTGSSAIFTVDPLINTLVTRVTGPSISNIDGLIQVDGVADFFLINPNGIVFGPNSSLDVGGSFLATTATHAEFREGIFSAQEVNQPSLLSLSTPIGLQFGNSPGQIQFFSMSTDSNSFKVKPGETLALVGGPIDIQGGEIISPQSHIEIGSVTGGSSVRIAPTQEQELNIEYDDVQGYQDIRISQLARIDSSGVNSGLIRLHGRQILVTGGSQILSQNLSGNGVGRGIYVTASEGLDVLGTGPLDGELDEVIRDFLEVFNARRSSLSTNNFGQGIGGDIEIQTRRVSVHDGGDISTRALGKGKGGDLRIKASDLIEVVGNTVPLGSTPGLQQRAEIFDIPISLIEGAFSASLIIANSLADGKGGNLSLETSKLTVRDGGFVAANPFALGDGGDINITATEAVELLGVPSSEAYSPGISIGPGPLATGIPGNLTINSPILRIEGGSGIGLSTANPSGALGVFHISDFVEIKGSSPNQIWPSSISALSAVNGTGGKVALTTPSLRILDGGTILARGANSSVGGDVEIVAGSIFLDNQSSITTEVEGEAGGFGGNINLEVQDILVLRHNSEISARAGNSGSGGNISLRAKFIIAVSSEDSDITATAVRGQGGNINLRTNSIFGLEVSDQPTPASDINASSELGIDGTVTIEEPNADLDPVEIELSSKIETPQLTQGCLAAQAINNSSFIQTGRGGIPIHPVSAGSLNSLWQDLEPLRHLPTEAHQLTISSASTSAWRQSKALSHPPQEAIAWISKSDGNIKLVASKERGLLDISDASTCTPNQG